jgi:hypothetical protein
MNLLIKLALRYLLSVRGSTLDNISNSFCGNITKCKRGASYDGCLFGFSEGSQGENFVHYATYYC